VSTKQSKKVNPQKKTAPPIWLLLLIGAGAALLVLVAFGAGAQNPGAPTIQPQVNGAPRLRADKEKVDLGNVKLGETVSVSFEITNVGDQPLRFTEKPYVEVKAGC
jgi:hypothetical protein